MGDNKYAKLIDREINDRLKDNSWDFAIAGRVLAKKNKARKKALLFSFSSAVSGAVLALLLFVTVFQTDDDYRYDAFISQQVSGVRSVVFNSGSRDNVSKSTARTQSFEDSLFENSIDDEIDTALYMRL